MNRDFFCQTPLGFHPFNHLVNPGHGPLLHELGPCCAQVMWRRKEAAVSVGGVKSSKHVFGDHWTRPRLPAPQNHVVLLELRVMIRFQMRLCQGVTRRCEALRINQVVRQFEKHVDMYN